MIAIILILPWCIDARISTIGYNFDTSIILEVIFVNQSSWIVMCNN